MNCQRYRNKVVDRCTPSKWLELDDCIEIEVDWRYMVRYIVGSYILFLREKNCLDNLMAYLCVVWNNRK